MEGYFDERNDVKTIVTEKKQTVKIKFSRHFE